MSGTDSSQADRELQLNAIIHKYYLAAEQGRSIGYDEFVSEYPDFKIELREFFEDLHLVETPETDARHVHTNDQHSRTGRVSRIAGLGRGSVLRYFGEYELLEELGAGGMGVVFKARQKRIGRLVALKLIRSGELASTGDIQRFRAEARAAARLSHPGIVSVHEVGVQHGQHYYTMDYVEGGSLATLHRHEPVASKHAASKHAAALVRQLAEAIHYAHLQGIIHRDLKPTNVLLTLDGQPRITDFGLAKQLSGDDDTQHVTLTETGQILGTAGYMAPEQAAGKTKLVGTSADIYALGAVLYALITGRAPFVGESVAHTLMQVTHNDPVRPRTLNPSVPRDLETVCLKCLEKEPYKRFGTAQLLALELDRFGQGMPVLARPISSSERVWRWCKRNPTIASLTIGLVLALLFLGGGGRLVVIRQMRLARDKSQLTERNAELVYHQRQAKMRAEQDAEKARQTLADLRQEIGRSFIDTGVADLLSGNTSRGLIRQLQAMESVIPSDPEFAVAQKLASWWSISYGRPLRHSDVVNCVCISPNGKIVATGSQDRTLKLWDAHTGKPLCAPLVHDSSVVSALFHPSENMILTASARGIARLWDTVSGSLIRQVVVAHGVVRQMMFSPDGERFVAAGDSSDDQNWSNATGYARIFETATGVEVGTLFAPNESIHSLAYSPDSSKIATGCLVV